MPRVRLLLAVSVLLLISALPTAARADGSTADFTVSQTVYQGQVAYGTGAVADPSANVVEFKCYSRPERSY